MRAHRIPLVLFQYPNPSYSLNHSVFNCILMHVCILFIINTSILIIKIILFYNSVTTALNYSNCSNITYMKKILLFMKINYSDIIETLSNNIKS